VKTESQGFFMCKAGRR